MRRLIFIPAFVILVILSIPATIAQADVDAGEVPVQLGLTSPCAGMWVVTNPSANPVAFAWTTTDGQGGIGSVPGNGQAVIQTSTITPLMMTLTSGNFRTTLTMSTTPCSSPTGPELRPGCVGVLYLEPGAQPYPNGLEFRVFVISDALARDAVARGAAAFSGQNLTNETSTGVPTENVREGRADAIFCHAPRGARFEYGGHQIDRWYVGFVINEQGNWLPAVVFGLLAQDGPVAAKVWFDTVRFRNEVPFGLFVGRGTAASSSAGDGTCTADAGSGQTYVVQPGDNLFRIALRFGVSLADLAAANCIANPRLILIGQVLAIP